MSIFTKNSFSSNDSKNHNSYIHSVELEYAEEELRIFQENIESACLFLKQQAPQYHFSHSAKTPLYLVIGAGSAGKSTLLTQSGLNLIDAHRQNITNPSSTRYCHFWFSPDAIWVDTAGHYTTASPQDISINLAWRGLIKLIHSYKKRCPLSGLIIAIDLADLAKDPHKAKQILLNIRQRIYEISRYVQNLPMFLVLTKIDLIAGFNDFFADLTGGQERQQPFGISFQDLATGIRPIQIFAEKFDKLMHKLQSRVFWRMQHEVHLDKRGLIQDFPLQIEILKDIITEIVNEIPHNAQTKLQGIYFTSSIQHGSSVDCLPLPFIDTETNIENPSNKKINSAYLRGQQPYFVEQMFQHISGINNSKNSTSNNSIKNKSSIIKNKKIRSFKLPSLPALPTLHIRPIFLTIAAIIVIIISSIFFVNYSDSISSTEKIHDVAQNYLNLLSENDSNTKLDHAYSLLQKAKHDLYNYWWPFSQNQTQKDLITSINKNYQDLLTAIFIPQLKAILEANLNNPLENPSALNVYSALKTYLMLSDESKRNIEYVQSWFSSYFDRNYSHNKDYLAKQKLFLKDALKNNPTIDTDDRIINVTRTALNNILLNKLIYSMYANQGNLLKQKISAGNSSITTFSAKEFNIPKLYTEPVVTNIYKQLSVFAIHNLAHDWVLGLDQEEKPSSLFSDSVLLNQKVRSVYLTHYVIAWNNALNKVQIKEFENLKQAANDLQNISLKTSPLLNILELVKVNTISARNDAQFNDLVTAPFTKWQEIDEKKLQRLFANLAISFQTIISNKDPNQVAWIIAKKSMKMEKPPKEIADLQAFAKDQPEPLRTWLMAISNNSWKILLKASKDYLNTIWTKEIAPKYAITLQNRYPFTKDTTADANLEDFKSFFAQNGIIDKFFNTYLEAFVDISKPYWVWKKVENNKIDISQDTLEMFIRASLIRKMFFQDDNTFAVNHFVLTPIEISPKVKGFKLDLEGQLVFAAPGKMFERWITWPGPKTGSVRIEFISQEGKNINTSIAGPWAWFKLLDKSNLQNTGNPRLYEITFDLNGYSIKYRMLTSKVTNPFIPDIINNFKCVDRLD